MFNILIALKLCENVSSTGDIQLVGTFPDPDQSSAYWPRWETHVSQIHVLVSLLQSV